MARKKYTGSTAKIKHDRAIRNARRERREQETELAVYGLDLLFSGLDIGTETPALAHEDAMDVEVHSPTEEMQREHVPVEANIQKELIKNDPDMANYKMVYMVDPNSRVLILRFPGRPADQPYCARNGCKPLELRIKPKHGHVEIDIPIDIHSPNWNKVKAIKYQQAMRKSSTLQQGKSYDMAGGFGVDDDAAPAKKSKESKDSKEDTTVKEPSLETLLSNIDDANNKGHVMNKITLGGRIQPFDPTKPRLMAGTFKASKYAFELSAELSALLETSAPWVADYFT